MGLWNFLGGNQIGPGHPRYERELRKYNESQELKLKNICRGIMLDGMPGAKNQLNTYEQIISVLKHFPNCPKFREDGYSWGNSKTHIDNWKQAQQWLKEKENPKSEDSEYVKQLEQKNKELEARIEKLEKQNSYEK